MGQPTGLYVTRDDDAYTELPDGPVSATVAEATRPS